MPDGGKAGPPGSVESRDPVLACRPSGPTRRDPSGRPGRQGTHVNRIHRRRRQALVLACFAASWRGRARLHPGAAAAPAPEGPAPKASRRGSASRLTRTAVTSREDLGPAQARTPRRTRPSSASSRARSPSRATARASRCPLELEGTDRIFVVLAEFGDQPLPAYCSASPTRPAIRVTRSDPDASALRRPAAQPDPRARPDASTTPRCGRPTTTGRTTRTCTSTG